MTRPKESQVVLPRLNLPFVRTRFQRYAGRATSNQGPWPTHTSSQRSLDAAHQALARPISTLHFTGQSRSEGGVFSFYRLTAGQQGPSIIKEP